MAGIAALALAYVLSQFYRSFLAVLTPALTADLGATKADLSAASGAWFIAFALMQFIVGVLLDKIGPRRTAVLMLALGGGGGAAVFAAATAPWMVTLAMVMIGIGCSPVLMASFFIFARTYPPARFAMLASWLVAFGSAGNVIGASPLAMAAEAFGWRGVMAGLGAITLAAALLIQFTVRDPEKTRDAEERSTGFSGYLELLRLRVLWPLLPLMAIHYSVAAGIRGLWAGPYLADVFGADTLAIGEITLVMAIAMVVGSFVYGPLDTLFRTRKWVAVSGNLVGLVALAFLAANPQSSIATVTIVLVVIGVAGMSYGLLMAHARAFFPAHLTGRGVTLINFFAIGGVGLMQFLTGAVVTAAADPAIPVASYTALWWFYVIMLGGTLAIYLASRDMRPEST